MAALNVQRKKKNLNWEGRTAIKLKGNLIVLARLRKKNAVRGEFWSDERDDHLMGGSKPLLTIRSSSAPSLSHSITTGKEKLN